MCAWEKEQVKCFFTEKTHQLSKQHSVTVVFKCWGKRKNNFLYWNFIYDIFVFFIIFVYFFVKYFLFNLVNILAQIVAILANLVRLTFLLRRWLVSEKEKKNPTFYNWLCYQWLSYHVDGVENTSDTCHKQ